MQILDGAIGLCQWLDRRPALIAFCSSQGKNWTDLDAQIQFLCMETDWTANYEHATFQFYNRGYKEAFIKGTLEEATIAFRKGWERCGDDEARDDVRLACAKSAYETFSGRTIEYPIEKIAASSTSTGTGTGAGSAGTLPGVGVGGGEIQYGYEDMYFAYYQIEQWYEKSGFSLTSVPVIQRVALPDGGFSWPVDLSSGNDSAKKILGLYGVSSSDGIKISTGNVCNYDIDEKLYKGADVIAAHSGVVKKVVPVTNASTYAYVEIQTEDGKYKTHYGNLSETNVTEGSNVSKGTVIGKVGNTGSSATCDDLYLTYKIYYNGSKVDPLQYYYIKDSSGNRVNNYNEVDKTTIQPGEYTFDGSRQYTLGSSQAVDGNVEGGIEFYYTSTSGRVFNCYLQNKGPWASSRYGDNTISYQGCNIVSVATVLTGYGFQVTPQTFSGGFTSTFGLIQSRIPGSHSYSYNGTRLDTIGGTTGNGTPTTAAINAIANHLASGKEVIVNVGSGNRYAGSVGHWMAILDIREGGSSYEVFVADPWSTYPNRGWRTLEEMTNCLWYYILVDEDS